MKELHLLNSVLGGTKENFRQNECNFSSSHNKNIVLQLCVLSFPLQFSAKTTCFTLCGAALSGLCV